jgi:integrase/recombinase XerD
MKREAAFSSSLGPVFRRYVELKRVLGRDFSLGSQVLHSLDQFLGDPDNNSPDLTSKAFQQWCRAQEKVSSGVRRSRMRTVYNFCLYRRRTEPHCFVPDLSLFPLAHPGIKPYIFSESDTARLLAASSRLRRFSTSPLRPEVIGLAISLLYT